MGSLGRFQLRERMGDGGFGSVFRAYDPRLDRDVAVKVLKQPNPNERVMERFFREARAVARLDHPNIVAVYDAGFDDGRCWVAYQLVSGRPLWWYREHHPMDAVTSARIVRALADALDHSHYLGVVHRDLKPANVIVDDRGQPRLIDFGLARRSDLESDLTRDGAILGTPAYMSPEQALGHSRQVDERTDVYSLGVIFYELLTGHHPDEPTTTSSDRPPPPRPVAAVLRLARKMKSIDHSIPRALRAICAKAMATDPAARYPSGRALADELDAWLLREERRSDRLRLALAGVAMGLSLAVVLLLGIRFVAPAWSTRPEPLEEHASISTAPIASEPKPKDPAAAIPHNDGKASDPPKNRASAEAGVRLIGNSKTGKYHLASCRHLDDVAEVNRVKLASAVEAAQKKYKPCKDCKPLDATLLPTQIDPSPVSGKIH
jgi:serine/threonine protein kinase